MPRHEAKDPGVAALAALGYDRTAPTEQALETLRSLRERAGATPAAIARALGSLAVPGAAQTLAEMEVGAAGADRREIRRALFRLRQRGIEPPASPPAAGQAPAPGAAADLAALLSAVDGGGTQVVWILKNRVQGGVSALLGLVSEGEGLVSVALVSLSRRELRAERAEIERRAGARLIEADWRLADFILCEAYRRTPEARRGQVGNFLMIRAEVIASPPAAEFIHPVYHELAAEAAAEPSPELLKEPEIAAWKYAPERLKPYLEEVQQMQQSPLLLGRLQQEDRLGAVVERALDDLLGGPLAALARQRLENTAYYLARTGRRTAAGWAAAAAARIGAGAELKRSAFFQTLIRSQLSAVLAQAQQREHEEPRLILTPAEAMRAQQQSDRR